MPVVAVLDLRRNCLQGIPYSLLRFRSLTMLDISHNSIEADSVPVHLHRLAKLKILQVEENPFVNWTTNSASPAHSFLQMRIIGEERVPCDQLKAIVVGQEVRGCGNCVCIFVVRA